MKVIEYIQVHGVDTTQEDHDKLITDLWNRQVGKSDADSIFIFPT